MEILSSSLRACAAEETLLIARQIAPSLGISRVTDITRLDRLGIPVFTSVRPDSHTICVHAGKGLQPIEACVGAYMEAIEFAMAEPGRSRLHLQTVSAREVLSGFCDDGILALCPVIGASIPLNDPLPCVEAIDMLSGEPTFIPAELAFHPAPSTLGKKYFGSSTNGLCSGNGLLETSLHGLLEVIERDVRSFTLLKDFSRLIDPKSLPDVMQEIFKRATNAGLRLFVRHWPNEFHLPAFSAYFTEKDSRDPIFISGGYGCHLDKTIAVTRAVCEAAQSRLTYIHGARDDLIEHYEKFDSWGPVRKAEYGERLYERISHESSMIPFDSIATYPTSSLNETWDQVTSILRRSGIGPIFRVLHTSSESPLVVAKIIVPQLEHFNSQTLRCGPRLARYMNDLYGAKEVHGRG